MIESNILKTCSRPRTERVVEKLCRFVISKPYWNTQYRLQKRHASANSRSQTQVRGFARPPHAMGWLTFFFRRTYHANKGKLSRWILTRAAYGPDSFDIALLHPVWSFRPFFSFGARIHAFFFGLYELTSDTCICLCDTRWQSVSPNTEDHLENRDIFILSGHRWHILYIG